MQLLRLRLRNWCRHLDKEVTFHPQMNVILGPNGSGKSTLMHAVVFALTGKTNRAPGKKDANVAQLAPPGESAYVELDVLHGGMTFHIVRVLAGRKKSTLVITAQDNEICTVTGENHVSVEIEKHLGVNTELLDRYVFIAQGAMFAPFDPNVEPSARMVAFQRLFNVERIEALWLTLGERLESLPMVEAPDVAGADAASAQAAVEVQALYSELVTYGDVQYWNPATDPATVLLQQAAQAAEAAGQLPAAAQARSQAISEAWRARAQLRLMRAAAADAHQRHDATLAPATAAQARVAARTAYAAAVQQRAGIENVLRQSQSNLATLPVVGQPAVPDGAFDAQLADARNAHAATRHRLQDLQTMQANPTCRTCGQSLKNVPTDDDVVAAVTADGHAAAVVTALNAQAVSLQREWASWRDTESRRRQLQEAIQAYTQTLQAMPLPTDPGGNAADDAALASRPAQAAQVLRDAQAGVANWERAYFYAQCAGANAVAAWRRLRTEAARAPDPAVVAAARADYDTKRQRQLYAVALAARYEGARANHARAAEAVRMLRDTAARAAAANAARNRVAALRALLHRDVLGRAVLSEYLAAMLDGTNETLAAFGVDFRLRQQTTSIDYVAVFPDGRQQPIGRLSGGQKVLASLAFMIAVNTTFAAQLGLFCPDEPTEWLDADNQSCIETAVSRLRTAAAERQLQTIMVTHAPIGHLFDNVIQL